MAKKTVPKKLPEQVKDQGPEDKVLMYHLHLQIPVTAYIELNTKATMYRDPSGTARVLKPARVAEAIITQSLASFSKFDFSTIK